MYYTYINQEEIGPDSTQISWILTTSPYASNPSLFFASEALTGLGELKISSSSSSYLDISLLSLFLESEKMR